MKYKFLIMLVFIFFISGCNNSNKFNINDYKTVSLPLVLQEEGINTNYNLSNYKEDNAKVVIYLFRGRGCSHCYDFLNFVSNNLLNEYGNDIKIQSYEVWYNSNNKKLMNNVKEFLGDEEKKGVPYIVIGDKSFIGYIPSMADEIRVAIDTALNSYNKYDVIDELTKSINNK